MTVKLITPPDDEPVTLAEAKSHLRVDDDYLAQDADILDAIAGAREQAENITRRALVRQQWQLTCDRFPSPLAGRLTEYWLGQQWGLAGMGGVSEFPLTDRTGYGFQMPFPPLISIDSIKYDDTTGTEQTLDPSQYRVDLGSDSHPARIMPGFGFTWPLTRQQVGAVRILFTCGYAQPELVPRGIKKWILLRVGSLYEHREEQAILTRGKAEPLAFVDRMLDPYRTILFS